jgi:hypothetical protein
MANEEDSNRIVTYCPYFVAFIDLLGQRHQLSEVAAVQWDQPEAGKQLLLKCASRVRSVRNEFDDYFTRIAANISASSQLTTDQLAEYRRMRQLVFNKTGFSDSFVVSFPLTEGEFGRAPSAISLWAALYGIAGTCLTAMARGIPIRGGIDIGFGLDMFPHEVYGPPLLSAYQLESECAEYPRVLVGKGVEHYLGYIANASDKDGKWGRLVNSTAEDCRKMIIQSPDDRRPMLHMLSAQFVNALQFQPVALAAYKWAKQEHARHQTANDEKLASRYFRLLRYFNAAGFAS